MILTIQLQADPISHQAYLKASNAGYFDTFGSVVAISGNTVVVGAPTEDSAADVVNGNQADDSAENAGAAYVFIRNGDAWTQQAYLKPFNTDANDRFGSSVAISGDIIVVGAPQEASNAIGVGGGGADNSAQYAGAAYVFVRSGTTWTQQAYLKASNTQSNDLFGSAVAVSGETVAVGAFGEQSSATGINGEQSDNSLTAAGAVYLFKRSGGLWAQEAYVKASNTGENDEFGWSVALSGETLLVGARMEFSAATGVNGDQSDNSANQAGAAYVFVRNDSTWTQQAYMKAHNTTHYDWFGQSVALFGDTAVIGANQEQGSGTGVNPEDDDLLDLAGAAYVFVRQGTSWTQQAYLKASNTDTVEEFGGAVAISGDVAVVGASWEDSASTGANGDETDNGANRSGAAYVFLRTGEDWVQQAYLKASNTDSMDHFAAAVGVHGDTVVVGAPNEASAATGINGDQGNTSAAVGAVYAFTGVGAPAIGLEHPPGERLLFGEVIDFGRVGVKMPANLHFDVFNLGSLPLSDISVSLSGTGASHFKVSIVPDDIVAPGDHTTFTLEARPVSTGIKTATVHVTTNDPSTPSFDFLVKTTGFTVPLPAAVTGTATNISFEAGNPAIDSAQATLSGTVDAKGYARDVLFDYGTSTALGNFVVAIPAFVDSSGSTDVSATLKNLPPHSRIHYRVRAEAEWGGAKGTTKTFVTPNRPVGPVQDTVAFTVSGIYDFAPQDNDIDGDNDPLRVVAVSKLNPTSAGSASIVDGRIRLTTSASFNGATMTYDVSDGFGSTATSTITLMKGMASVNPIQQNLPAGGGNHTVNVNASGRWSVRDTATWVTVSPASGTDNEVITITVAPNPSKAYRYATVYVGSAYHHISQAGVQSPSLNTMMLPPGSMFNTIVGEPFSVTLPTINPPVTYSVTGFIPPGMKINHTVGRLEGIPTKYGSYPLKIGASNAAGKSPTFLEFTIDVQALDPGAVGTFHGFSARSTTAYVGKYPRLGGRVSITTTSAGFATGKITEGNVTRSFTGRLACSNADPKHPVLDAPLRNSPFRLTTTWKTDVSNNSTHTTSGKLHYGPSETPVECWGRVWSSGNKASAYKALHSYAVQNLDIEGAQGFGFGSFKVSETSGDFTASGRLADHTAVTSSSFVGPSGQILLYNSLYGGRGSFLATATIIPGTSAPADNRVTGSGCWLKPSPLPFSTDTIYKDGFGPVDLTVFGGTYRTPDAGDLVMGLSPPAVPNGYNARFDFTNGGLDTESKEFHQTARVYCPTSTSRSNLVSLPPFNANASPNPNPNRVTITVFTASSGRFSGSFTIPGATSTLNRRAPFHGQIVRTGASYAGYGCFLLPKVPTGNQTVNTAPKLGGRVKLVDPNP